MNDFTRFGLAAAFAVVLAANPSVRAAEPDKLLPADSEFVLSANVKQIAESKSEIIKKFTLEQLKYALKGADAKRFLTDFGLDPMKDVERLVVCGSVFGSAKDQTDPKALLIIHGKFDPAKLFKAAEAQIQNDPNFFSLVKEGKYVMLTYHPEKGNPVYGAVVDETTVIASTEKKMVTTALGGGSKTAMSKDLSALISKQDDKVSLWVVGVVKDNLKQPKGDLQRQLEQYIPLEKVETVAITVRVTADFSLDVSFGMKDADDAEDIRNSIDKYILPQIKDIMPFLVAKRPQLKALLEISKNLKSLAKDRVVSIPVKMPGALIDELLKWALGE